MSKIALVAVARFVNGERKVFQPGEPLPELNKHDEEALLNSKSIKDPADDEDEQIDADIRAERGARAFQRERELVQAESASTRTADIAALGGGSAEGNDGTTGTGGESSQTMGNSSTSTDSAGGASGTSGAGTEASGTDSTGTQSHAPSSASDTPPAFTSQDATASTKPAAKTTGKNRS